MRLLESDAAPERRGGGTMTSMVVHAAIVVAAVAGTVRTPGVPEKREVIVPIPRDVWDPPAPEPAPRRPGGPASPNTTPTTPGLVIPPPVEVCACIPPVNIEIGARLATDAMVTIGATGGAAEGGFGGAPYGGYGAPDASGTWDARTVEVPVVPDARNPSPSYPEMLRTAGMTGRVVAEFVVDSTGRVRPGSLVIVEASHDLFASSVRRTVPSFRFAPARVQGRKVAQRVRVPFEFEIAR
jgi:periplasmic protein TonB